MSQVDASSQISVRPLDEVSPADAAGIGGKAYHCARLRQAGFPVPDGFVVLPACTGSAELSAALDEALRKYRDHCRFAVRSSAAEEDGAGSSFAGIHETWLNVSPGRVLEAIAACRASRHSPRAAAYRQSRGITAGDSSPAVLVQLMAEASSSGVAFTMDPVTGDSDVMVVNSAWGLGEAVVGGMVEADQFRLSKARASPPARTIGDKRWRAVHQDGVGGMAENQESVRRAPSLTDEQLHELAQLLIRIERHYGAPQDIEWRFDGQLLFGFCSRGRSQRPRRVIRTSSGRGRTCARCCPIWPRPRWCP